MTTAILGTGLMGAAVAQHLHEAKQDVIAWNRHTEKATAALGDTVKIASQLESAVDQANTLLLFLSDAAAIESVLEGLAPDALAGKTLIQMGTIAPEESRGLLVKLASQGAEYFECPVLGSIPEARSGTLLLMVGATEAQFEQYRKLLHLLGKPRLLGPVGKAAAVKLAMNQLIAGLTASFALSLNFVLDEGADVDQFMDILRESALYAPTFDKKLDKMLQSSYHNPNFPLKHLDKDVKLFLRAAARHGLNTAALKGVEQVLEEALRQGHADDDYSALRESI